MAHGRARLPPQKGHASSAPKDQGTHSTFHKAPSDILADKRLEKRPQGVAQHRTTRRRSTRLQQKLTCESSNSDQSHSSPAKNIPSPELLSTSGKHTTKRRVDALDHNIDSSSKRPRRSPTPKAETTPDRPGIIHGITHEPTEPTNPIEFWARQGQWPQEYFELDMEQLLARKKSLSSLGRKRSNSAASTATPSDQKPREEKSAPYRDSRYETLLETKGSFMGKSSLDISSASKTLTRSLLEAPQPVPEDSLFRDDIFESTCQKIHNRNEARVIQDITRPFPQLRVLPHLAPSTLTYWLRVSTRAGTTRSLWLGLVLNLTTL
jgi:hypothetical protein